MKPALVDRPLGSRPLICLGGLRPIAKKVKDFMSYTPRVDAATYAGWIAVDDGEDPRWHTDRQEWTKAEVARQLERELADAKTAFLAGMKEAACVCDEATWGDREPSNEYERGWRAACKHLATVIRARKDE
jgi:hypothetical protein